MKRLTNASIFLVIIFSLLLFSSLKTDAATVNKITMKVQVGFNNNYKIGYSAPVTMTIDNKYRDIQGEIEIRVPSSSGKYVSYVKQISMKKDSQKSITINIPINGNRVKYKVVVHNGKETVYEDDININNTSNTVSQFIGILSEDIDSVSYINSVPTTMKTSVMTIPILLNEKNFPEDFLALKNFDLLVINNFDTTKLNKVQYEILKQWVKDGGTLLIGTGNNQAKTLGIFKDDFIKGSIGKITTVNTSAINSLATNGESNSKVNIEVLDMNIENSKTILEDNGVKLVQSLAKGRGVVGIAAFDLGQSPFVGWNNNSQFAEKLLETVNPDFIKPNQVNYNGQDQDIYSISNIMNQFSELASAKTSSFYIILFIYIIIVAPISYLVLKKLDKREFMWITVPAIAIIFGFIVFVSGAGGRIKSVTANVVSEIYMDEAGNSGVSTYAGIFTPKKMKIKVESKEGKKLFYVSNPNYNGNSNQSSNNADLEAKVYVEGNGGIEYHNTSILQNSVLQIQQQNMALGKLESNIQMKGSSLSGEIKNSTKMALEDCYVITPGEYYKLGDLKVGESKTLPASSGTYQGNIYDFGNKVFMVNNGANNPANMSQGARSIYIDNNQKMSMINLLYAKDNMTVDGVTFIGFSKSAIEAPLIINNGGEAVKNERSILGMPLNVNFKQGNLINYPMGFVPYEVVPGNTLMFAAYNKRLNGNGTAEIEYFLDKAAVIDTLTLNLDKLSFNGNVPVVSIYNIEKNSYEETKAASITGEDIKKYIDNNNKFKLKIEIKGGDSAIPKVAASGKVK